MGDPDETIRRVSMIPDQIQESLNSRRFSLAVRTSSNQSLAQSQPQRATMLPGQIRSSTAAHRSAQLTKTSSQVRASQNTRSPLASKRQGSQLQGPDTPEVNDISSHVKQRILKAVLFVYVDFCGSISVFFGFTEKFVSIGKEVSKLLPTTNDT